MVVADHGPPMATLTERAGRHRRDVEIVRQAGVRGPLGRWWAKLAPDS